MFPYADPESFVRGGPTLTIFFSLFLFLLDEGGRMEMSHKVGHHRPASETPLKWRFTGVPIMAHK